MAKLVGSELTTELYRYLDGSDIASKAEKALVICTIGADGWPHPAVLSYYEVVARDPRNLHLATYKTSHSTANMRARGKATLVVVDHRLTCYIKGSAAEIAPAMRSAPFNARLNLRIDQVLLDEPHPALEPGAFVRTGITYTRRTAEALSQAEAVLAELRDSSE
jgi:hypothetical protein